MKKYLHQVVGAAFTHVHVEKRGRNKAALWDALFHLAVVRCGISKLNDRLSTSYITAQPTNCPVCRPEGWSVTPYRMPSTGPERQVRTRAWFFLVQTTTNFVLNEVQGGYGAVMLAKTVLVVDQRTRINNVE